MGSSSSKQSSSALKYELRDSWAGTDLSYCWSASGFKGCAWRSGTGSSRLCSYVNDTQSFTYYPSAAPVTQSVYSGGDVDTIMASNEVYGCPTEAYRYVSLTRSARLPSCMCQYSKIKNNVAGTTLCYGSYGAEMLNCGAALFSYSAWNVYKLDAQLPHFDIGHVDSTAMVVFGAVGLVAAALGVALQRKLKANCQASQDESDSTALYSLLTEDDLANRRA